MKRDRKREREGAARLKSVGQLLGALSAIGATYTALVDSLDALSARVEALEKQISKRGR